MFIDYVLNNFLTRIFKIWRQPPSQYGSVLGPCCSAWDQSFRLPSFAPSSRQ